MSKRPTPKGGFGSQGEDFTYLRQSTGHKNKPWDSGGGVPCSEYQNADDFDDMFGEDNDD